MATVVRFTQESYDCYTYHCDDCDDNSGEYVPLADYRHDLANVQQELIAAQEEIKRLREALESIANANLNIQSSDTWVDEAQMIIIAQKALK